MKTYFTADPHIGHVNMTRAGKDLCGRPFDSVDEMNEALLEGINSVVGAEDQLVILGDVCMGKLDDSLAVLSRIRAGQVFLIPGNHDRFSNAYHHKKGEGERTKYAARYEVDDRFWAVPDKTPSAWRGHELGVGYDRKHPLGKVWFSHYPYDGDSHGEDRYAHLRVSDAGRLPIIHGHVHTEWRVKGRQFNVGVDVNEFRPVGEEELADWVRSLE